MIHRWIPKIYFSFVVEHLLIWRRRFQRGNTFLVLDVNRIFLLLLASPVMGLLNIYVLFSRRQDSSIGIGAPVHANMRTGGSTNAEVTSSLLESVRIHPIWLQIFLIFSLIASCFYNFCAMHILIPLII